MMQHLMLRMLSCSHTKQYQDSDAVFDDDAFGFDGASMGGGVVGLDFYFTTKFF